MRRAKGMKPLPLPVQGAGDALGDLRVLLGFDGEEHDDFWALVVGYMFAALRPKKPYFVASSRVTRGRASRPRRR